MSKENNAELSPEERHERGQAFREVCRQLGESIFGKDDFTEEDIRRFFQKMGKNDEKAVASTSEKLRSIGIDVKPSET